MIGCRGCYWGGVASQCSWTGSGALSSSPSESQLKAAAFQQLFHGVEVGAPKKLSPLHSQQGMVLSL